ncbi:MAG: hypothetical protein ACLQFR_00830 [Streptosporangiaceae bacterium]
MTRIRAALAVLASAGLGGLVVVPMATAPAGAAAQPLPDMLVAIRAAHHPGSDRLVFQFRGGMPDQRSVRYASTVIADPSGKPSQSPAARGWSCGSTPRTGTTRRAR